MKSAATNLDSRAQTIQTITEKLQKHPGVKFLVDDTSITVPAVTEEGFSVSLRIKEAGYMVFFEGWHEEFTKEEDALNCFGFGLSEACRLKVFRRGKVDYKWVVQHCPEKAWVDSSLVALLWFPFWRSKVERLLQNHVVQ